MEEIFRLIYYYRKCVDFFFIKGEDEINQVALIDRMNRNLESRLRTDFVHFSLLISCSLDIYENSRILLPFIATLITYPFLRAPSAVIVGQSM